MIQRSGRERALVSGISYKDPGLLLSVRIDQTVLTMAAFRKLVRFTSNNQAFYGDLIDEAGGKYTIRKLIGDVFGDLKRTEEVFTVENVRFTCQKCRYSSFFLLGFVVIARVQGLIMYACSFSRRWKGHRLLCA